MNDKKPGTVTGAADMRWASRLRSLSRHDAGTHASIPASRTAFEPWTDTDSWCLIVGIDPPPRSCPTRNCYGCLCLGEIKIQKHFIDLELLARGEPKIHVVLNSVQF
jgi:hypothetical protein